ncbi:hypothetical protein BJ944DRAFT_260022 [Cunninghamella echinulata]|nr:hypothetical protein BJ944DRAFT_260022 [Cunninghamella echinulata]
MIQKHRHVFFVGNFLGPLLFKVSNNDSICKRLANATLIKYRDLFLFIIYLKCAYSSFYIRRCLKIA